MTLQEIYENFEEKNKAAEAGGGEKAIAKQKNAGKLTARERIDMLLDDNSFVEIDKFLLHDCNYHGMDKNRISGDGVVAGYGRIDGRLVYVYAYDFTVYGGSLGRTNANKIVKLQKLSMKNGVPIIALNDSGGARIQEGVMALSGFSDIFYHNIKASGVVPQISAILGPCAGGACYSPALTDFIFMVKEKSYMFVTGPDVVKTVTHEELTKEELGGASVHASKSGVAHFVGEDEEETLMMIRELLSFLPSNNMEDPPIVPTRDSINRESPKLQTLIPDDPNIPYDMKVLIEEVVDENYFLRSCRNSPKTLSWGLPVFRVARWGSWQINRLIWPVCWISTRRIRRRASSVFAIVSTSLSSRLKTCPVSFRDGIRSITASSGTAPRLCLPMWRPPCPRSRLSPGRPMAGRMS